ncbi:hypothetical protein MHU86_10027 [Fragilaria crotonensis]|nr:hypothetical protein MHU86_10027 [Fragilaria crotonensis]
MALSTGKLIIVALLGALAVFMGTLVLTLQVLIVQRTQHFMTLEKRNGKGQKSRDEMTVDEIPSSLAMSTITPSQPTKDIYLWKKMNPDESSKQYAANAYWSQVKSYLGTLGDITGIDNHAFTSFSLPPSSHIHTSLVQAASLGHSDAQHYVASSLASGIWLTGQHGTNQTMPDDFMDVTPETVLLWHMAALDGNVEAAVALGHRISAMETDCSAALPYFEAAAHSIMDQLETDMQSRAKVNPPMDKHSLPEIHLHGGTSSQLTWDNKPDESPEAIQYYHLLSTRQPDNDIHAAYTLAHLYHFGLRGVSKNLTKALYYYEIAAEQNHWEAAGQAGKFHFWSLGMEPSERDIGKALAHFEKGAPVGINGCRERYRQAVKLKTKSQSIEETSVAVCDHPSLNGLGLLHLYGVPDRIAVDINKARAYFQLSRDMGNMDASYNLAMLGLGFNAGWKELDSVSGNGQSRSSTIPAFMETPSTMPSKKSWIDALQYLQSAADKGHLQARHRLAMIYQDGVQVGGTVYVQKDCKKASQHYRYVIDNGSPQLSKRTRTAYKQYMAGDSEGALINYLMAAETGHSLSQVNAAFLLDRGTCLHLSKQKCRIASLRLWKAAALSGDQEAALRVGDFYYYGIKRDPTMIDAVLFPENHLLPVLTKYANVVKAFLTVRFGRSLEQRPTITEVCEQRNVQPSTTWEVKESDSDADMEKAAHYYRLASQKFKSARANFNLGFMHEWGLGLKQDFPLAKRHYDLAKESSKQAGLAVQIALMAMNAHEQLAQLYSVWQDRMNHRGVDELVAYAKGGKTARLQMIMSHVVSWESLLILALTYVLSMLFRNRRR